MSRRATGTALGAALLLALVVGLRAGDGAGRLAVSVVVVGSVAAGIACVYRASARGASDAAARWTCVLLLLASPLLQVAVFDPTAARALQFLVSAALLLVAVSAPVAMLRAVGLALVVAAELGWRFGSGTVLPAGGLFETLFASRGGLLFWYPGLWLGVAGLFLRREGRPRPLSLGLTAVSLLGVAAATGTAGVDAASVLPILGLGAAAALDRVHETARRRPGVLLATAAVVLTAWNLVFMEQFRRNLLPRDATVSFATVAAQNAELVGSAAGSPVAWPANWIFAARTGLPPSQYDLLAGRWLLADGAPQAVIDVGAGGDNDSDAAYLGDGWGVRQACESGLCREVLGRALIVAPLRDASDLDLTVRARGEGALSLGLNGTPAGAWRLGPGLADLTIRVPAARWRSGLNRLELGAAGGQAAVDHVVLRPLAGGAR